MTHSFPPRRSSDLFNLGRAGHIYSRSSNPTVAVLEERIAALEHGVAALATGSGHAALHLAIATLMGQGGHIVASSSLYGGSINLFTHTLPRFGITTSFVKLRDRSEEHTSELQSLMRTSYAVSCLKKKK